MNQTDKGPEGNEEVCSTTEVKYAEKVMSMSCLNVYVNSNRLWATTHSRFLYQRFINIKTLSKNFKNEFS